MGQLTVMPALPQTQVLASNASQDSPSQVAPAQQLTAVMALYSMNSPSLVAAPSKHIPQEPVVFPALMPTVSVAPFLSAMAATKDSTLKAPHVSPVLKTASLVSVEAHVIFVLKDFLLT